MLPPKESAEKKEGLSEGRGTAAGEMKHCMEEPLGPLEERPVLRESL